MSLLWSLPVSANRSALLRRLDLHLPSFELNSSWSRPQWPHHPGRPLEARWHDNDAFYTWAPNSLSIMIVNRTREGDKKMMLSTPERPTLRQARTWQQREQDQPTLLSPAICSQTCLKSKKFIWNLEQLNISCLFFSWDFQSQQRRCLSRSSTDSRSYKRDKSHDWVKVILKLAPTKTSLSKDLSSSHSL